MSNALLRRSERMYALLLKLYPKSYAQEFADEMRFVFSQSLKDAYEEKGDEGVMTLWGRTVIDTCKSVVIQHIEAQKGGSMKKNTNFIEQNKDVAAVLLGTAGILAIPLIGAFDWTTSDFVIAGAMLLGFGLTFVFGKRHIKNKTHAMIFGGVLLFLLVWLWVELAVGLFTNWGS